LLLFTKPFFSNGQAAGGKFVDKSANLKFQRPSREKNNNLLFIAKQKAEAKEF